MGACTAGTAHPVVRTLRHETTRGAFVPPYAYEAYVRGELLLAQGRPAEAAQQLELAATAPDEDPYLLSRLAYAQLLSGSRAEAEATIEHAAELDRCSEAVWLMRGKLAETTQELGIARAAYMKASSCAPRSSAGELALVHLLLQHHETATALDLLTRAAERHDAEQTGDAPSAQIELRHSLQGADPAMLAHAFGSLGAQHAPDAQVLEQAIGLALDRDQPRLALRLREQHVAPLPVALEARLLAANGLHDRLAALLAANDADAFGGPDRTAQLALEAHAYERAELEAGSALEQRESDAMHAIHARATLALGHTRTALTDVRAIQDQALKRSLLTEALSASGVPALAREVATTGPAPAPPTRP